MNSCKIENGMLILDIDGKTYSFEAHGEEPRPSLLGISVGGKHWSDRSSDNKLQKHTSVQDIKLGNAMVAWYTQEFIPDGLDYKISKNAKLYIGFLETGEQKLIYKGECYGDLCFYKNELYFNTGNKIAFIDTENGECTLLFKHSGVKKNYVRLHITKKRIFFIHWTHNENYFMWYDRETKEVVNPHIDIGTFFFLDDETVIYQALYNTWLLDINTKKKKRFFSGKQYTSVLKMVCDFLEIPAEEYKDGFKIYLSAYEKDKLYFLCSSTYESLTTSHSHEDNVSESFKRNLPWMFEAEFSCNIDGSNLTIEVNKDSIIREVSKNTSVLKTDLSKDFYYWKAVSHNQLGEIVRQEQ